MFGMSNTIQTPYFVMYEKKLIHNLKKLNELEEKANIHILHTVKSFNQDTVLPIISAKLSGMSVTSPKELDIAKKANAKKVHLYAPAFKEEVLKEMIPNISTLSLNSLTQWQKFLSLPVSKGLRINPKLSLAIPTHCNPNLNSSRLGVDFVDFLDIYHDNKSQFEELEGLHFHALFQDKTEGLSLLLEHIVKYYQKVLPQLKWINLGGGHNFTDANYDVNNFVKLLDNFQTKYPNIKLYFEPGETVTKGCGDFMTTVLDIVVTEDIEVAILDTSIETHLLDVAIVNQSLQVKNTQKKVTPYFYELSGNSCLQGDLIGKYYFTEPLQIGDTIVFEDMMPYTMVKMTEFNGMEKARFYLQ
ncbi:MAG: Carboxynorspermidine decarboxylase, putative (EC [uncultured Sulfurovum sp.]|uniref:Carboxynorspermidine/carboxyspermidine decarboxylase n=1 Tax=uncultured Sulfurovum sp. TaxID=269237 RepID=A0A6S6SGF0_9BACT|nr:MAG: Carboxynorspermidine decarboxylase, putative (EC [uncultured Sulfurovum sp.]